MTSPCLWIRLSLEKYLLWNLPPKVTPKALKIILDIYFVLEKRIYQGIKRNLLQTSKSIKKPTIVWLIFITPSENWKIPQSLAIVSPLLTWKIKLALSLSVVSSGESTGICFVNLMSNWETSSSLRCWGQNQWNRLAWLFQVETTLRTHKQWFDWRFKTTCQYIVPVDMLEERMRLHCHRIIWSATQTLWLLSLHQASHQISGFGCEVCWQIKFSF